MILAPIITYDIFLHRNDVSARTKIISQVESYAKFSSIRICSIRNRNRFGGENENFISPAESLNYGLS